MNASSSALDLLRQMPVFGGLKDSTLELILSNSQRANHGPGEYFFRENDFAQSLFVIQVGKVCVEKVWHGKRVEIRELGPGDCFGEMAIVDLETRSASIRVDSDCEAIEISRSALHTLYEEDLEQYAIIMMNMGREISRRLRTVSQRLFELDQQGIDVDSLT